MLQRFDIDGIDANEPNNYQGNRIKFNWQNKEDVPQVSIDVWELGVGDKASPTDAVNIGLKHVADGMTGGVGITEGKPANIFLDQNGVSTRIAEGFLDFWSAEYECGKIKAKFIEKGSVDYIKSESAAVSFERLYAQGFITEADFILVPYVISTIPNYREAFMATITIAAVTAQLYAEIQGILELTSEGANPLEASSIARLVLRIIYIATLLIALIKLIIDVFNLIIQPVKYHAAMYVNDLLRIGAASIGLSFASSVLQAAPLDKLAIIPKKFYTKNNTGGIFEGVKGLFDKDKTNQKGFPGMGYTFRDLLADLELTYNLKIVSDGVTMRLEKQSYNFSTVKYQIPPVDRSKYTYNKEDFISNFIIEYATDLNDRNTIQEIIGAIYQVEIMQIATNNELMRMGGGLQRVSVPFARGVRKRELTFPEKIFKAFFDVANTILETLVNVLNAIIAVVNAIIRILNKIIKALSIVNIDVNWEIPSIPAIDAPSFGNLIEDRLDMLMMETDFVYTAKMILVGNNSDARNNKLLPENEAVIRAKYLWDNFHFFKSFVPQPGNEKGNQHKLYPVPEMPFVYDDYQLVKADNKITDSDDNEGELLTLDWIMDEQVATDTLFKINETYTHNLIEIKIEPNGI